MLTSKSATAEPNAASSSRDRAQRTRKEGSSPGRKRLKRPDRGKGERGRRDKGISQTGGSNLLAAAGRPHERGFFALQHRSPREPAAARGVRRLTSLREGASREQQGRRRADSCRGR